MPLEQTKKEQAAIGASIGAGCRPCIEHHVGAAREAGLTDDEIAGAVAEAEAVRGLAVELLTARIHELLGDSGAGAPPADAGGESGTQGLAALGANIGGNAHSLLEGYVQAALANGLTADQVQAKSEAEQASAPQLCDTPGHPVSGPAAALRPARSRWIPAE